MFNLRSIAILLTTLSLLSLASFGFGIGFMANSGGSMDGCPFSAGQMSMCPMTLNSHVGHWLRSLLATQPFQASLLLLVLLAATLFASSILMRLIKPPQMERFRQRFLEQNSLGKIFNHFLELFSSGILHPKVFSY